MMLVTSRTAHTKLRCAGIPRGSACSLTCTNRESGDEDPSALKGLAAES
jgi:hypothetical protein